MVLYAEDPPSAPPQKKMTYNDIIAQLNLREGRAEGRRKKRQIVLSVKSLEMT